MHSMDLKSKDKNMISLLMLVLGKLIIVMIKYDIIGDVNITEGMMLICILKLVLEMGKYNI
jgi:hypothetical protein